MWWQAKIKLSKYSVLVSRAELWCAINQCVCYVWCMSAGNRKPNEAPSWNTVHEDLLLTAIHLTKMFVLVLKDLWKSSNCCAAAIMQNCTESTVMNDVWQNEYIHILFTNTHTHMINFVCSYTLLLLFIHHHITFMELGHLLTCSGLTYPEVSSEVYHDSSCQLGSSASLLWVIYFEAFYLHVVLSHILRFTDIYYAV